VHVGVGVDGEHEAQPTFGLTLLRPPACPSSLAHSTPLPVSPPSVHLSLPTFPSLAMSHDDAAFTSLKARTDISPCDNADTTPLPASPLSVPFAQDSCPAAPSLL
jgi:hypothetical protein